jgi:hypothetical protein
MAEPFQPIGAVAVNVVERVAAQAEVPLFRRYPGVARVLANRLARRIVERQLQAQGFFVAHVPYTAVTEQAQAYLAAHPELLAQAVEYRPFVEREERERQRKERNAGLRCLVHRQRKSGH